MERRGMEGGWAFHMPKNTHRKPRNKTTTSFNLNFFVLWRKRKQQEENMSEFLLDVVGGCSSSTAESRVLTCIMAKTSTGSSSRGWALSLAVAFPARWDPAAVGGMRSPGTRVPALAIMSFLWQWCEAKFGGSSWACFHGNCLPLVGLVQKHLCSSHFCGLRGCCQRCKAGGFGNTRGKADPRD